MAMQTSIHSKNQQPNKNQKIEPAMSAPLAAAQMLASDLGAPDEQYALISVLYHSLKGAEIAGKYAEDARRADDEELVNFFADLREEYVVRAGRARSLLLERASELGSGTPSFRMDLFDYEPADEGYNE